MGPEFCYELAVLHTTSSVSPTRSQSPQTPCANRTQGRAHGNPTEFPAVTAAPGEGGQGATGVSKGNVRGLSLSPQLSLCSPWSSLSR